MILTILPIPKFNPKKSLYQSIPSNPLESHLKAKAKTKAKSKL
jgi:hypothetical protein